MKIYELFPYFSVRGYYFCDLYIKPYFYVPAYANGLIAGYFIETRSWNEFKSKYNKQITAITKICKIILLILFMILSSQTILYENDLLPKIAAIEAGLFPSLMSLIICVSILNESYFVTIKPFLSLTFWRNIKQITRVSYVYHPIIFEILWIFLPSNNLKSFIFNLFLFFLINFIICKFLQINLEKPIIQCSNRISKKMFVLY